jgi:molybdopterin synthase catalytic subunit
MQALADDVMGRWALDGLMIWHRVGEMAPGDPIVLVAAASRHRRDALPPPISRWTISRARVGSGSAKAGGQWAWVEPREQDYADLARWR